MVAETFAFLGSHVVVKFVDPENRKYYKVCYRLCISYLLYMSKGALRATRTTLGYSSALNSSDAGWALVRASEDETFQPVIYT